MYRVVLLILALIVTCMNPAVADEPAQDSPPKSPAADTAAQKNADADREQLYKKFTEIMSGSRMVGRFTVTGKDDDQPLQKEEYQIRSVSKLPNGDYWLFQTRIKYGDHDLSLPLPIEVKWADQTPVITVDQFTIPGLGTFDARVVIDNGKYAGTWAHGDVGGHLFGEIEKLPADELREEKQE